MVRKILLTVIATVIAVPLMAFKSQEIKLQSGNYLKVESDQLIIYVGRLGGRLSRLYCKSTKQELVNISGRAAFTEIDWDKSGTYDFLYRRGFSVMGEQKGNKYVVTCRGHHMGGGLNFLVVTKRYIIEKGSPVLTVEYDFHNQDAAMTKVRYNLQIHTGLTLVGCGSPAYYMPGTNGIKKGNYWLHNPARGWMGTVAPNGNGMAVTMSFPELFNFLIWDTITMEWRYLPMDIENGKSFRTSAQVIPFSGLPKVSGAGGGVAGALIHSEKVAPGTSVPVEIKLFDGYGKRRLTVELLCRDSGKKIFRSVKNSVMDFKKPGNKSCRMTVPGSRKSIELEAVVYDGKKELARLNSIIRTGDDKTPWAIDMLEEKIKADLRRPDLTCFTAIEPEPDAVPWAKPLAGKKLKVLALGPKITQLADLTHRFDMEFNTCWIAENGQGKLSGMAYLLGDFAGKATINDVISNLRKAVSKKYDIILIAGISWRIIPAAVQKAILKQVEQGTGLVYAAVNGGYDFLKLSGSYKRTVKRDQVEVVKNSPLTSGVPLDFLPVENVADLSGGEEIHARAGDKPYIVSARYGNGRIVGYCYYANPFFTGLIPCDKAEPHYIYNKPVPYEFFYAMLLKGMLYAAQREMPLKAESFAFKSNHTETSFAWNIVSRGKFDGSVEYFITDRHNEIRSKGMQKVSFRPGNNKFELKIPVCEYGGKQLISMIFRDQKKHSAAFGSWSFKLEPEALITAVGCDKKSYVDGENINYEVRFSNLPVGKKLLVELVDSFGRTLARKTGTPAALRKGSFVLKNQLPSRYSKIRAYLIDGKGRTCDTGGAWFYTRPAEKLLKWDDYKIASIIYWNGPDSFFRMKRTAESYRRIGLDILFNNWGLPWVLLGNFEPRMWALSGIGSQNFPSKEYLDTGNKMYLGRKNCISDEQRLEKYYEKLAEKAKTGYSYGAVVYDNGDEVALSRAGAPVDFCFSEACLRNFRIYLKKQYNSLENLNNAWKTSFHGWDQVVPFTKEEVWKSKGKYVAGWADHREFMDYLCWEHLKKSREVLRKYDPTARYMNSGTQYPNAYGGIDWWKLMQCHDSLQNYSTGDSDEIHRSFAGKEYASFPWYVGYGSKGPKQVMGIWRSALLGSSGVSMWCIYEGVLFPDMTMQPGTVDSMPHLMKLKNGVGKLLMHVYRPRKAEVAILYSQASLRAAFIERRMREHTDLWTKYIWMCRNMGAEFRFISYEQLANGELNRDPNLKLLILGDCTALSDMEIKEIQAFFARGGNVLAEGMPATRYANCVKRSYPALKPMFLGGKGKAVLVDEPDTDYPTLIIGPDSKLNRKQLLSEQSFFRARMKKCGIIERPFAVYHEDGTPVIEAMYFLRKAPDGSWLGGIVSRNDKKKKVRIELPLKGHVYNLVDGRYYGRTNEIKTEFSQGTPMALVVIPEKIMMQKVTVSGKSVSVKLNRPFDTVVNIKVFNPRGREVREYGTNLVIRKGYGKYTVPFAMSDVYGKWEIRLLEVISGTVKKIKMHNNAK